MPIFAVKGPPAVAVHPGVLMRRIIEDNLHLSLAAAAARMGVTRQALYAVAKGESALTADMALRFGRFTGGTPDLFVKMQAEYDLWRARQRIGAKLEAIVPVHP